VLDICLLRKFAVFVREYGAKTFYRG